MEIYTGLTRVMDTGGGEGLGVGKVLRRLKIKTGGEDVAEVKEGREIQTENAGLRRTTAE